MIALDSSRAECLVFTFKEGVLSPMAHDLELRVTRFEIRIDPETPAVRATFDAHSLRVVAAVKAEQQLPEALSPADKQKIEGNITERVLHSERHPEIRFESERVTPVDGAIEVTGSLTLHGRTRSLRALARRVGAQWVAELPIHQPDFGIKPYTAMLGALKIQPDVRVRLSLPADVLDLG